MNPSNVKVAYITAEIATSDAVPTYSGGLGALSGDTLKQAADLGLPIAFFSMMAHKGYFKQVIDNNGRQRALAQIWDPKAEGYSLLSDTVEVQISGRDVKVKAWLKMFVGEKGEVPLYLLDTDIDGNTAWDRNLAMWLYDQSAEDREYLRLCQDTILGSGSVKMARALGYSGIETFHLNDPHGATATYELLKEKRYDPNASKELAFFTTHTPVPAGFDSFSKGTVENVLGGQSWDELNGYATYQEMFNHAYLCLNLSRGVNAVGDLHAEVCRGMDIFKGHKIFPITNGVYAPTWVSPELGDVYRNYLGDWKGSPELFAEADKIPLEAILEARKYSKERLLARIKSATGVEFDPDLETIAFGRRAALYKQGDLLFSDPSMLMAASKGKYQFIFGMKAHPNDIPGQDMIQQVWRGAASLRDKGIPAVFLDDYSLGKATDMVQGSTLWLNNPIRLLEACGTSGMKLSLNGGLNSSILDGWWAEAYNGRNGFAIAPLNFSSNRAVDAASIYHLLMNEVQEVLNDQAALGIFMRNSIKLAARFNTKRMLLEYAEKAWRMDMDEILGRKVFASNGHSNGHNGNGHDGNGHTVEGTDLEKTVILAESKREPQPAGE